MNGGQETRLRSYDVTELVSFVEQSDRSVSVEPMRWCPLCRSPWLGGVPGRLDLLGCQDCGALVPKRVVRRG